MVASNRGGFSEEERIVNRQRLEYCTEAFLSVMRSQRLKLNPNAEVGNMKLASYPPAERSTLMQAIGSALKASNWRTWW